MRRQNRRDETYELGGAGRLAAAVGNHPRETVGLLMVATAFCSISFNALFLQNGPHPAPIFATRPVQAVDAPAPQPVAFSQPAAAPEAAAPDRGRLISDIQRELSRRGYYDGAVDGIWGAKTDAATRDFVQAANVKINAEASDGLLRAIVSSNAKAQNSRAVSPDATRKDPIAELIAPSKRMIAIQRALADFGYGQIKPSGNFDGDTRAAIEKFERDHRLPVTGDVSDRFVRELAAMTGRPLE